MQKLIHEEIKTKIENLKFSDGSKFISRASEIIIKAKDIGFSVDISGITHLEAQKIRELAIKQIKEIKNIDKVSIILTSDKQKHKNTNSKIIIDDVQKIILIASGKGGVGKSTIASLFAQKLASEGKKIGLIDADIYGPSIPKIFNVNTKPEIQDKRMIPLEKYGVKINSIGFITEPSASINWRGPMASKALYQLISLTHWGELDYLIIDTPPGTGDIHLSILQNYEVSGVLMVTTPQQISAIDVERSINLYKKFDINLLGIIQNMSYYMDSLNHKISIFSGNGAQEISERHNIPILASIPILPKLSTSCDKGENLQDYFEIVPPCMIKKSK